MEKKKFAIALMALFESKLKNYTENTVNVWYEQLKDYPEERLLFAIKSVINDPIEFFNIGTIIERMQPLDVGKAWEKIVSVAAGGCREWRKLTDVEIATVSAIGGMGLIQDATEEGLPFLFNDFKRTYPIMMKREIKFISDSERLKDLNMIPETYKFITKFENIEQIEIAPEIKQMVENIGQKI